MSILEKPHPKGADAAKAIAEAVCPWDCPETIFTNAAAERGIHEHIAEAISACDQTDRMELYHNVVIAGGTSCFQGFEDRLSDELTAYGT